MTRVLDEHLKSAAGVKKLYLSLTMHLGGWSSTKICTFHRIDCSPIQIWQNIAFLLLWRTLNCLHYCPYQDWWLPHLCSKLRCHQTEICVGRMICLGRMSTILYIALAFKQDVVTDVSTSSHIFLQLGVIHITITGIAIPKVYINCHEL